MTGRILAAAAATAVAVTVASAQTAQRSFLVSVIPSGPAPVTDLTAQDFTVKENGQARPVVKVERPPFPLAVSLVVDTTQPPPGMNTMMRDLRAALAGFVSALRASSPGVRIELVEVSGGAMTAAALDANPEHLDAVIEKIFPAHPGDAVMLEAIGSSARTLAGVNTPRRAIVTVDINSSESLSEATMKRMTTDLTASGATVWSVSVRLPRSSASRREAALNLITEKSGGLRLVANASSGLAALLQQVAASLASQYLVTFSRPDQSPPGNVTMETARGLKVNVPLMSR